MTILGIETSCDETGIGIVRFDKQNDSVQLLNSTIASSIALHAKTGGIIPETAAREQVKYMLPTLKRALHDGFQFSFSGKEVPPIDAIAVTYGPGLIGSLLVGVETAKTLSYVWKKPLIPVNHMYGHIYANWLRPPNSQPSAKITFPAITLVVSGGHTDLLLMKSHTDIMLLGGTRDDAAGEAFDKIGRILNLPYPGGPAIENAAKKGNPHTYKFPRPLWSSDDFEFSFSGLKAAVSREVQRTPTLTNQIVYDISYGVQDAIISVLLKKTITAAEKYMANSIILAGGVAANKALYERFTTETKKVLPQVTVFAPSPTLCTDNGAMIACCAAYHNTPVFYDLLSANPQLYY